MKAQYPRRQRIQMAVGKVFTPRVMHPHAHPAVGTGLRAPQPISPPNGTTFSNYPRTTTLRWAPVQGAASYTVEIDCFHCCEVNKWCTDVGKTWQILTGIADTTCTFDFVGAQPGRWRVWAVGRRGRSGRKSRWSKFIYTI